ncbi:unnamed protein product [Sphagnum jensenii]|uniref:Uncharacterized protein n=1 Tax=Sphagnum jensenii TaxID=128206 RepID=A0ABP1B0S4_9BRYO
MSGMEDRDVYRVKQKFVRPRKPDEHMRKRARRSVHLPVYPTSKQSEHSAIPRWDHAHSRAVRICEDFPRRRPRAECFRQLRFQSAPAPSATCSFLDRGRTPRDCQSVRTD